MKLIEKISNNFSTLNFPEDVVEFITNPSFADAKKEIISNRVYKNIEIDLYTDSVSKFDKINYKHLISFLSPIIEKYKFNTLIIDDLDDVLLPGSFFVPNISKIIIGPKVKNIPNCMFANFTTLKEVELSNGVETIGDEAFLSCRFLKKLFIPASINNIGNNICGNCIFLESLIVDKNNKTYCSLDSNSIIETKTMKLIQGCYKSKFKDGLKIIGYRSFWKLPMLKEALLSSSIEKIEDETFYDCINLADIYLPHSLARIGQSAFSNIKVDARITYNGTINEYKNIQKSEPFQKIKCLDGIFTLSTL